MDLYCTLTAKEGNRIANVIGILLSYGFKSHNVTDRDNGIVSLDYRVAQEKLTFYLVLTELMDAGMIETMSMSAEKAED